MARRELDLKNAPWRDRRPDNQLYGYYISFDATGCNPVDEVLRAVASAAKNYHSTECWRDADPESYSHLDWIQFAAQSAADEIATLRERVAVLERVREAASVVAVRRKDLVAAGSQRLSGVSGQSMDATAAYNHAEDRYRGARQSLREAETALTEALAAAKPAAQEGKEAADGN